MNTFEKRIETLTGGGLWAEDIRVIQVNIGLKCNLACRHCHVVSSPWRTEMMDWETLEAVLDVARQVQPETIDITGGAPEMNPHFRRFVKAVRDLGIDVMVRTNLVIMLEPGYEDLPEFFRDHRVHLIASLPCYLEDNVDRQRGDGVFRGSIEVIRRLNHVGYGIRDDLPLDLVYNPIGPSLPPDQSGLEAAYKKHLGERFGIQFTRLLTITNMPIGRFFGDLKKEGKHLQYQQLLYASFNPATLDGLMCRHQINVRWDGTLFDCDFNLALKLPVGFGAPSHIRDFDPEKLVRRRIVTGNHCFGCTAGQGSSCGGALVNEESLVEKKT